MAARRTLLAAAATILVLGLPACAPTPAQSSAATATVSWTNPSANTDGTAFTPATDQRSTEIFFGTTKGGPYPTMATLVGDGTTDTVTLPASCGVTYYFVAETVSNAGTVSAPSNEASKTMPACPPATPQAPNPLVVI